MDVERLERIDAIMDEALIRNDIPGGVVLVSRADTIVFHKAYGFAQYKPIKKRMQPDMIFDLASVTKPIATATSVMMLVEAGKIRFTDRVSDYVPEFSRFVYEDSTMAEQARIWHLLTHTSGLLPYTNADEAADSLGRPAKREELVEYIARLPKISAPGEEYHYSCLGFITLAFIVEKVTGQNIHQYSKEHLFDPLNMHYTGYVPPDSLLDKVVPTERVDKDSVLLGIVHDPLARLQGGISGNAGLYSNASDLLQYARMMLNNGQLKGTRILSPLTTRKMIEIPDTPAQAKRGYGWVVKEGQSWVGGDLFPDHGFGHTGYTGTSIWIDRETRTIVIILTHRVHPEDDGSVSWLRSSIANIVASSIIEINLDR
jgi:CubicO group peptidase (beta-lactamase class C family)